MLFLNLLNSRILYVGGGGFPVSYVESKSAENSKFPMSAGGGRFQVLIAT